MADEQREKTPLVKVELRRVDLAEYVQTDVRLRGCGLLRELGDELAMQFLKAGVLRRFSPRTVLYDQAQRGNSLFWVVKGEAWLALRVNGQLVDLGPVQRGEVFGESEALGEAETRPWLVRASGQLDVAEFPQEAVRSVGAQAPSLLQHLSDVAARRSHTQADMLVFLNRW